MKTLLIFLILSLQLSLALAADSGQMARVIVKYKADTSLLKQTQSADRASQLSGRLGLSLQAGRQITPRSEVMQASGISSTELASRLAAQPDVEYAVPDRLRTIRATTPNDPLYAGQWFLQSVEAAAIKADAAWDKTTGSSNVVIAFVDTGVRFDHPDLASKLLPGYDFISDTLISNDGDGRDPDASDPGDYITVADSHNPTYIALCGSSITVQNSSWHGTRVAGILAAASNNSTGIAGVNWGARLLPIRALGKCGGYDSDIIAGMLWAAGISVPGIPDNLTPAKIINLSLGSAGTCNQAYLDPLSQLSAKGVLVVAAAGNESGPVDTPANCSGVLAVAGVRNNGVKVGYSSFGTEVGISAPAGNCVNTSGPCLYSIDTTTNSGTTVPSTNTYTDQTNYNIGTSFSSPMVAGAAGLMLSVNPNLGPGDLINRIKSSAAAFPSDPSLSSCPTVNSDGQCNCTTSTCGAGLLDVQNAVATALLPTAIIKASDSPMSSSIVSLDGTGSIAATGLSIASWSWKLVSAPAGASLTSYDKSTTSLQTTNAGTYVVSLTVTDSAGNSNTTQSSLSVAQSTTSTGTSSGGGGGGAIDPAGLLGLFGLAGLAYFTRRKTAQSRPAP